MLQQMSSFDDGEVVTNARPLENSHFSHYFDNDDSDLPDCKIKRNYNCSKCNFYTQNPRAYLVHTREVHFARFNIYECLICTYASKHNHKLLRHIKMVHPATVEKPMIPIESDDIEIDVISVNPEPDIDVTTIEPKSEPLDHMEDMLEEIEESEDQIKYEDVMDDNDMIEEIECNDDIDELPDDKTHKSNMFYCNKCTYKTHVKTRYTKHIKYHSMPMIKCVICEFCTPYKWNLDRHMKNHGGPGSFRCSMCNFAADIKQSLTVHEVNHHSGQSFVSRRRNRVGASDAALDSLIVKEEEGSGDSASEMGLQCADIEMVSCNSESNDASMSETSAKKDDSQLAQDRATQHSPTSTSDENKTLKQTKKAPRPLPQLIPLNASTPNQNTTKSGEPPSKKFKESKPTDLCLNLSSDITVTPVNNNVTVPKENVVKKKNNSFFDKLKERLLTETGEEGTLVCKGCGFESKCLSEHSVHEKTCSVQSSKVSINTTSNANTGSTRCQNCRHRCKSSADLIAHMQTCKKTSTDMSTKETSSHQNNDKPSVNQGQEPNAHPMENVVFVWNNINQDTRNYQTPLGISINDDSTLPEIHKTFDLDIVEENESMNLSPSQALGKKVFKCPHCPFWAATASRFHVHIVGHLNKRPFECSLCKYKSNWRWDITKHIKLKSARDPEHNEAKVLMTDETGRRNYSKYNKFLAMFVYNENGENEFHYLDQNASVDGSIEIDESCGDTPDGGNSQEPLNLQTQPNDITYDGMEERGDESKKPKKTLWKCKRCNYKDASKEALLEHVREHSRSEGPDDKGNNANKRPENAPDPADLAYRCGHCNQLSNWKHVIQRHCRLKHDGIIKVITTVKPKLDPSLPDINGDACTKCPFRSSDRRALVTHLQQHQPSPQSIFKCYFCPFFVKNEQELMQHLVLHGITDPEEYIAKAMGSKSPLPEIVGHPSTSTVPNPGITKRHKCTDCPYETNSKSQYMYHEQFHRISADSPYKCPECNYSVSKRHLLHQHLRVHGIISKRGDLDSDLEMSLNKTDSKFDIPVEEEEIPFVWVSAKNEFHKMYKCRYCSYVNSQKCKIPTHEKIHYNVLENSQITIYKCLECKFTCDNSRRLAYHSKMHGEIYGRIYCPVEDDVPDEEQIATLRKILEEERADADATTEGSKESKLLYFCHKCPARFFSDNDLKLHDNYHENSYPHKCKSCEFSVPEDFDLPAHVAVHTEEYHKSSKAYKYLYITHPGHKEPLLELVQCPTSEEMTWVVSKPSRNFECMEQPQSSGKKEAKTQKQYCCKECPAKFFKTSALSYHASLHGGEGEFKCRKCSYAVKNIGNLAKHELLHENENKPAGGYESGEDLDLKNIPLSGTDLFQRKTEAQKRVSTDKDKLVKPNDHFPPVLQADPQFGYLMHGNPEFVYPTYLKNGRQREKRYKCHKCPSAFEKREQYKIHLSLHGSKQRYRCELCDYSVKYYANYVQHMRKHQMNDEAVAERTKGNTEATEPDNTVVKIEEKGDGIKLAIKTMPKGTNAAKSDFQQFSINDQQILRLLQRRRSMNAGQDMIASEVSPAKERRLHTCILCPYSNQRQDSLTNHYRRHDASEHSLSNSSHTCSYCDLTVVQSHFLRDHIKSHFNYLKTLTPECFTANEDVAFTIMKEDDETTAEEFKLGDNCKNFISNEDKIFVKIQSGELVASS